MWRLFAILISTVLAMPVASQTLPAPTGKVILTIDGNILNTNADGAAHFDLASLEGLGLASIVTKTPWHKGQVRFEGPSLNALMKLVGARGKTATVTALNDYAADLPMSDFAEHDVILASRMDGQLMPVSNKGPLFVMYPFDAKPRLRSEKFHSRAVWQVRRITVLKE